MTKILNDDSDMKIAEDLGSIIAVDQNKRDTDEMANIFVRQKEIGNIDKARHLGEIYGNRLLNCKTAANSEKLHDEEPLVREHRKILFSYAICRVARDLSPNSILANTAIAVFYDCLRDNEEVYNIVNNTAAISLYMLTGRRNRPTVGHVFAQLCQHEDNAKYIELGNTLFDYYSKFAKKQLKAIGFEK